MTSPGSWASVSAGASAQAQNCGGLDTIYVFDTNPRSFQPEQESEDNTVLFAEMTFTLTFLPVLSLPSPPSQTDEDQYKVVAMTPDDLLLVSQLQFDQICREPAPRWSLSAVVFLLVDSTKALLRLDAASYLVCYKPRDYSDFVSLPNEIGGFPLEIVASPLSYLGTVPAVVRSRQTLFINVGYTSDNPEILQDMAESNNTVWVYSESGPYCSDISVGVCRCPDGATEHLSAAKSATVNRNEQINGNVLETSWWVKWSDIEPGNHIVCFNKSSPLLLSSFSALQPYPDYVFVDTDEAPRQGQSIVLFFQTDPVPPNSNEILNDVVDVLIGAQCDCSIDQICTLQGRYSVTINDTYSLGQIIITEGLLSASYTLCYLQEASSNARSNVLVQIPGDVTFTESLQVSAADPSNALLQPSEPRANERVSLVLTMVSADYVEGDRLRAVQGSCHETTPAVEIIATHDMANRYTSVINSKGDYTICHLRNGVSATVPNPNPLVIRNQFPISFTVEPSNPSINQSITIRADCTDPGDSAVIPECSVNDLVVVTTDPSLCASPLIPFSTTPMSGDAGVLTYFPDLDLYFGNYLVFDSSVSPVSSFTINQILKAGVYSVCYNWRHNAATSSVEGVFTNVGTFTVGETNPFSVEISPLVPTYGELDAVFKFTGTGLAVTDLIRFSPVDVPCYQLPSSNVNNDLVMTSPTTLEWTLSQAYYDNIVAQMAITPPVELQLCYLLTGATWANVGHFLLEAQQPRSMDVLPTDGPPDAFGRHVVRQFTILRIRFDNQDGTLSLDDDVKITTGASCSEPSTVTEGVDYVIEAGLRIPLQCDFCLDIVIQFLVVSEFSVCYRRQGRGFTDMGSVRVKVATVTAETPEVPMNPFWTSYERLAVSISGGALISLTTDTMYFVKSTDSCFVTTQQVMLLTLNDVTSGVMVIPHVDQSSDYRLCLGYETPSYGFEISIPSFVLTFNPPEPSWYNHRLGYPDAGGFPHEFFFKTYYSATGSYWMALTVEADCHSDAEEFMETQPGDVATSVSYLNYSVFDSFTLCVKKLVSGVNGTAAITPLGVPPLARFTFDADTVNKAEKTVATSILDGSCLVSATASEESGGEISTGISTVGQSVISYIVLSSSLVFNIGMLNSGDYSFTLWSRFVSLSSPVDLLSLGLPYSLKITFPFPTQSVLVSYQGSDVEVPLDAGNFIVVSEWTFLAVRLTVDNSGDRWLSVYRNSVEIANINLTGLNPVILPTPPPQTAVSVASGDTEVADLRVYNKLVTLEEVVGLQSFYEITVPGSLAVSAAFVRLDLVPIPDVLRAHSQLDITLSIPNWSPADVGFLIPKSGNHDACASAADVYGSGFVKDSVYTINRLPAPGEYTVCVKRQIDRFASPLLANVGEAFVDLSILPSNPTSIQANQGIVSYCGERLVISYEISNLDADLDQQDTICLVEESLGCETLTDPTSDCTSNRDSTLRAPYTPGRYTFCYRRFPGHILSGVWFAVSTIEVVAQNPTSYSLFPENPHANRRGYEVRQILFNDVTGAFLDAQYQLILLQGETTTYQQDPCMPLNGDVLGSTTVLVTGPDWQNPAFSASFTLAPQPAGTHVLCYRVGDRATWGSLAVSTLFLETDPVSFTTDPPAPITEGTKLKISMVFTDPQLEMGSVSHLINAATTATDCSDLTNPVSSSNMLPHVIDSVVQGEYIVCWVASDNTVGAVPPGSIVVGSPNPSQYTVISGTVNSIIVIEFTGTDLSGGTAKIIPFGDACSDNTGTPHVRVTTDTGVTLRTEWDPVTAVRGKYTICFMLASTNAWTKTPPGTPFIIGENPQSVEIVSPARFIAGGIELIQLKFSGYALGVNDEVFIIKDQQADCSAGGLQLTVTGVTSDKTTAEVEGCGSSLLDGAHTICYRVEGTTDADFTQLVSVAQSDNSILKYENSQAHINPYRLSEIIALQFENAIDPSQIFIVTIDDCKSSKLSQASTAFDLRSASSDVLDITFLEVGFYYIVFENNILTPDGIQIVDLGPYSLGSPTTFVFGVELPISTSLNILGRPPTDIDYSVGLSDAQCSQFTATGSLQSPLLLYNQVVANENYVVCYMRAGGGRMPLTGQLFVDVSPITVFTPCPISGRAPTTANITVEVQGLVLSDFFAIPLGTVGCTISPTKIPGQVLEEEFFYGIQFTEVGAEYHFCGVSSGDTYHLSYSTSSGSYRTYDGVPGSKLPGVATLPLSGLVDIPNPNDFNVIQKGLFLAQVSLLTFTDEAAATEVSMYFGNDPSLCKEDCFMYRNGEIRTDVNTNLREDTEAAVFFNKQRGDPSKQTIWLSSPAGDAPLPDVVKVGFYTVCVKTPSVDTLAYAGVIQVVETNPNGYTKFPTTPSAGQLLTLSFTFSTTQLHHQSVSRNVHPLANEVFDTILIPSMLTYCTEMSRSHQDALHPRPNPTLAETAVFEFILPPKDTESNYKTCFKDGFGNWFEVGDTWSVLASDPEGVTLSPLLPIDGIPTTIIPVGIAIGGGDTITVVSGSSDGCYPDFGNSIVPACALCTLQSSVFDTFPTLQQIKLPQGTYSVCYQLSQGSAAFVPDSTFDVSVGNPSGFVVSPSSEVIPSGRVIEVVLKLEDMHVDVDPDSEIKIVPPGECQDLAQEQFLWWNATTFTLVNKEIQFHTMLPHSSVDAQFQICFLNVTAGTWVTVPPFAETTNSYLNIGQPSLPGVQLTPPPGRASVENLLIELDSQLVFFDDNITVIEAPTTEQSPCIDLARGLTHQSTLFSFKNANTWSTSMTGTTLIPIGPTGFSQGFTSVYICYYNSSVEAYNDVRANVAGDVLEVYSSRPVSHDIPQSVGYRAGQLLTVTVTGGSNLALNDVYTADDLVIASLTECSQLTFPTASVSGSIVPENDGGSASLLVTTPGALRICFVTGLGAISTLQTQTVSPPNPSGYTHLPGKIYAGQLISLTFIQGTGTPLAKSDSVKLVDATTSNCWTATPAVATGEVDDNLVFQFTAPLVASELIVCYKLQGPAENWAQLDDILSVNPPHPGNYETHPTIPRVGQKVSLTVVGSDGELSILDRAFLIPSNGNCETQDPQFPQLTVVTATPSVNQLISVVLVGQYQSFSSPHPDGLSVCYRLDAAGATYVRIPQPTSFQVHVEHPSSWTITGEPLLGEVLQFFFEPGTGESDLPIGSNFKVVDGDKYPDLLCDAPPAEGIDVALSGLPDRSLQFIVEGNVPKRLRMCYLLPEASWSLLQNELSVAGQPIRCAVSLDTSATRSVLDFPRFGQQIIINLFPSGNLNTSDVGDELQFFEFSPGLGCGQTPNVDFSSNRMTDLELGWQVFLTPGEASNVRVCWFDVPRQVWIPLCFGCDAGPGQSAALCGLAIDDSNPFSFESVPPVVFVSQNFTLKFTGENLTAGDYVGLQPYSPGVGCSPDAVIQSSAVNESLTAFFEGKVPHGEYSVCYGLTGEVLDQMATLPELLHIHAFGSCSILPSESLTIVDSDHWAIPTRRVTDILPFIEDTMVTLGPSSLLALSSTADCMDVIEQHQYVSDITFNISRYWSDSDASSTFYVCLFPETTGWGRLCNLTIEKSDVLPQCTTPEIVTAGQYVSINSNDNGRYQVAPDGHICGTEIDLVAYPWTPSPVLPDPVVEGDFVVCFVSSSLLPDLDMYAMDICEFSVEKKTPIRAYIDAQCDHASVGHTIAVEFDQNHPLDIKPTENDTAAVTKTQCCSDNCLSLDSVSFFSINFTENAYQVILDPLTSWTSGTYYVCYLVSGQSWSFVESFTVQDNNPSSAALFPVSARAGQLLDVVIEGVSLTSADTVFASRSETCSSQSSPVVGVIAADPPTSATTKISFADPGLWYLCYNHADCTTPPSLGIGLTVNAYHPSGCQLPTKSRIGYSVRIFINPLAGSLSPLTSSDTLKFVYSNQSCSQDPAPGTDILTVNSATSGSTEVDTDFFVNIDEVLQIAIHEPIYYNVCYRIAGERFALAGGSCVIAVHPRNPHQYVTDPVAPEARKMLTIAFIGDDLREGDHVMLTTSPAACEGLQDNSGLRLQIINSTYSITTEALWLASELVTVCYYSTAVLEWIPQPEPLFFSVSNPLNYTIVPGDFPAPLAGVGFRIIFNKAPETNEQTFSNLTLTDLLSITSARGEEHTYPPDRITADGSSVFEIALNQADTYAVRYIRYRQDAHLTEQILFFEDLQVYPNPYGIAVKEEENLDPQTRAYNRITLVLKGKGLSPATGGPLDVPILPVDSYDQIMIVNSGESCPDLTDTTKTSTDRVALQSYLYAAENGASQIDVLFKTPGRYKFCYKRRTLQEWNAVPFYTEDCALFDNCEINVRNAHFPEWEGPKKGLPLTTLEGFSVTLTYNYTSWKDDAFVSVTPVDQPCVNKTFSDAGDLGFRMPQGYPTVVFTARINQTGVFKLCYHDPQFVATLEPSFEVSELFPNEVQIQGVPRGGGSILVIKAYANGEQFTSNRFITPLATTPIIIRSAEDLYNQRIEGDLTLQQYQSEAKDLCNGVKDGVENEAWVQLISSAGGEYEFSFPDNNTATAVVVCSSPDRFLGVFDILSGGMQGFTYNNNTEKLTVVGDGLTVFDELTIAKAGVGNCVTGGLVPATESIIQARPESVNEAGTVAEFPIVLGVEDIQICYRMADQTSLAPLANLVTTETTNVLTSSAPEPTSLRCTTEAVGKVNGDFVAGRDFITVTAVPENTVVPDSSTLVMNIVSGGPIDGLQFGTTTKTNESSWRITDITSTNVGFYVIEATLTTARGTALVAVCDIVSVLESDPTAVPTAVPTGTPTSVPVVVGVSSDDDCSGDQICTVHIIIIVCVVVLGLVVAVVAIILGARRGGDEQINVNLGPPKSAFESPQPRHATPGYQDRCWVRIQETENGDLEAVRYNPVVSPILADTSRDMSGTVVGSTRRSNLNNTKKTEDVSNIFTNLGQKVEEEIIRDKKKKTSSSGSESDSDSDSDSSSSSSSSEESTSGKGKKSSSSRSKKSAPSHKSKPSKDLNSTNRSKGSWVTTSKKSSSGAPRESPIRKDVKKNHIHPSPSRPSPPSEKLQYVEHPTTKRSTASDAPKIVSCPHKSDIRQCENCMLRI
eukprot:TRINITY_DN4451_c0_g1_i5.p1 TRINITY_DN4451_c0_g1~~TRINITY_DN4451_c0_g1_i5.p1  ORF type:complete len:5637 (+),score=947.48 TRINITY_DN4451_c0_g1_i5:1719-16913(+)